MIDNMLNKLAISRGVVAQGNDPIVKKQSIVIPKVHTVASLFKTYTSSREFNLLADSTKRNYISNYNLYVDSVWGKRDVSTIKRSEVKHYLDGIKADTTANGCLIALKQIQRVAIDVEAIDAPFLYDLKIRPAGTRTKILTDDEIVNLFNSDYGWDSVRNIAKMQLLTGARNGEVAGMMWDEVGNDSKNKNRIWTIPPERIKTERSYKKMIRPHVLPLMPKMAEILLQQRLHGNKGLVFPKQFEKKNTKTTKQYYDTYSTNFWLTKIGITGGTHILRKTVATRLSEISGISELDIKIILNHTISGTTALYVNSQQLNRKRELLAEWHKHVDDLLLNHAGTTQLKAV